MNAIANESGPVSERQANLGSRANPHCLKNQRASILFLLMPNRTLLLNLVHQEVGTQDTMFLPLLLRGR